MRRLSGDLIWLGLFEATADQPNSAPVDLGVLAQRAVDRFRTLAEAEGLSISLGLSEDSAVVTAPPEWLDRLIGVLLDNACKDSNPGGSVENAGRVQGGRVCRVLDESGANIPPEGRARNFYRFHRHNQRPVGTGLGLA